MDTQLTLSQIVDAVLGHGGSVKTAAEGICEKCGKPAIADSKMCRECAEKDIRKTEEPDSGVPADAEKTSSARVIKLASAVDFIVRNPSSIHPVLGRIKTASPPEVAEKGPGKGPNPMATNLMAVVSGEQSDVSGEAKKKVPMRTPTTKAIPGDSQPANAMEVNLREMKAPYPAEGPLKQASFRERALRAMWKRAADAENPASIASGKSTALPEDRPSPVKRPAEVKRQESLIGSNQAAIDVTKRQAKAVPKKVMAEVLSEPAQARVTDKILDENLGKKVVDQAGAKVASAKSLLKKVASEGCSCGKNGSCGHCKVAARLKQRRNGQ